MSRLPTPLGALSPLDGAPLAKRQWLVLAAAVLLAALDGYDALAMAFVAPVLSKEWQLGKAVVGLLLSSGLVGMAIGSLAVSPLADRFGRRPVILGSLALMTVGSLLSAFALTVPVLAVSRILTGIGIGTMIVMTTLISAEFSNARRRALAVAAVATIGFPLGGVLGGLGASALLVTFGWHSVFAVGAIAGAILLLLLAAVLPESPAYLISRRPLNALARLNLVLSGLGHESLSELPPEQKTRRATYRDLFAPGMAAMTLRLVVTNLLVATTAYFLVNWLPQLVADAGLPATSGSVVSAVSGLVGFFGGVSLGAIASRLPPARLAAGAMAGMGIAVAALGFMPPVLALFFVGAGVFGFFLSGTTGLLYGIIAVSFPSPTRASGTGLIMGLGRIASATGPALAGWMFATGWTRAEVCLLFAAGPLIAAVLIAGHRVRAAPDPV